MEDFWYLNPTRVYFGRDRVDSVGEMVRPFGDTVLWIYGHQSLQAQGTYARIKACLLGAGLRVLEHGGVRSNPLVSHVREGVALARRESVACVLGTGGGSVLDSAKAVAAGACADVDIWSHFEHGTKPATALPVVVIPTLAAAGSEMNAGVVLTHDESGVKRAIGAPCLAPRVALLDPTLTLTVPRDYTFYGVVDAFSHVMEPYFGSRTCYEVSDRMAEALFSSLFEVSERLRLDLQDYDARAELLWASILAGHSLGVVGRGRIAYEIHDIAHCLGGLYNVPHGAAISVAIHAWMCLRLHERVARLARFAAHVLPRGQESSPSELAMRAVVGMRDWQRRLGLPLVLGDLGVDRGGRPALESALVEVAGRGGLSGAPLEEIQRLVDLLLDGGPP